MNDVEGHTVPQNSIQVRSLSDANVRIAAEQKEMSAIERNKVIGRTSHFIPRGVVATPTMFIYALKYTVDITVGDTTLGGLFVTFLESPDVLYYPMATHARVASDL